MTPFDASLRAFLASLRAMLADPTIPHAQRVEAAMGVISAVSQMVVVAEVNNSGEKQ